MRGRVFISHSEKDKAYAQMLLVALEEHGTPCWIAPRDIPPGGSYADAIMRAIEECSCFLLVFTAHSNTSPHVLREVERALKFERNIIPARFDQSEPSRSLDYLLATVQWISIDTTATKTAIQQAAEQIAGTLAPADAITGAVPLEPAASRSYQPTAKTTEKSSAGKWIAVGAIVAVLSGAGVFFGLTFIRSNQATTTAIPERSATPVPALSAAPVVASTATPVASAAPPPPVEAPTVAVARAASPPPLTPPSASEKDGPEDLLRRYFASFSERDPAAAYEMFAAGFHSAMSFQKYSAMFSSTREIEPIEISELERNERAATLYVRFRERDSENHDAYWQGPIELAREKGQWRIKTLGKLKKVRAADVIGTAPGPNQSP